jgi:hypothetical protein
MEVDTAGPLVASKHQDKLVDEVVRDRLPRAGSRTRLPERTALVRTVDGQRVIGLLAHGRTRCVVERTLTWPLRFAVSTCGTNVEAVFTERF